MTRNWERRNMITLSAKQCGIEMTETRLFSSKQCAGYFGTKRFDRTDTSEIDGRIQKIPMISVSGLLETSHRIPNLDYSILMKLTLELTKDFFLSVQRGRRPLAFGSGLRSDIQQLHRRRACNDCIWKRGKSRNGGDTGDCGRNRDQGNTCKKNCQ